MKLVYAIVNSDDSTNVQVALTSAGFSVTKLATTGGFLRAGNTTFIMGVDDEKVEEVIELIEKHSKRRTQMVSAGNTYSVGEYNTYPVEISVGGATVFVTNVEQFRKL
jgi:uncharacterized protein YaaQ